MEDNVTDTSVITRDDEELLELTPEGKAIAIVRRDFQRANGYLSKWHKQCLERYKHYVAPGFEKNIYKAKSFPVPFTTEQVDQFTADLMDKLFYKNEPCSIYGREDTDKDDADVKREFMEYQDEADEIEGKVEQSIKHCAIYGIAPAVVNYKEEFEMEDGIESVPLTGNDGMPIMGLDGVTPIMIDQIAKIQRPVYQGASVEIVDPIDFFFTAEKRKPYDEHPFMIRSRRTREWFESKNYILKNDPRPNVGLNHLSEADRAGTDEIDDLLRERRNLQDYTMEDSASPNKEYIYIEWLGYADLGEGYQGYIIGVANDKILLRLDREKDVFNLGHPNVVVGVIARDFGEVKGFSLLDKFHSVQHAMDDLMGMWLKSLRQTVNNMWIADVNKLVNKRLVNEDGFVVQVQGDITKAIDRIEQQQISKDIYAGLDMLRLMGQNSSGQSDIAEGIAQRGVETLGEANILTLRAALRMKGGYLKTFESTFIAPLWKMRNQINMTFCQDPGYIYSVVGEKVIYWRTIEPAKVRSHVDFVCNASSRENQRAVVTQQVLQALNLTIKMAGILGPIPLIKLLEKLYEDGFGWKRDDIKEMLPIEAIAEHMLQQQLAQEQQQIAGENPQKMPQPKSESQAHQSANAQATPQVGEVK